MNPTYTIQVNLATVNSAVEITGISQSVTSVVSTVLLTGEPGAGIIAGGTTGQILGKNSNADFDMVWVTQTVVDSTKLAILNNLSDLNNAATARTNLGLGTAATQNTSAFDAAGTATTAVATETTRAEAAEALLVPKTTTVNGSTLSSNVTITTIAGNAGTATTLQTGQTIGIVTGDATSAGSTFNGGANNTNALTLATVNSNVGSFGSATTVAAITANAKGLLTAVTSTAIQIAESQVTNLTTDLAAKQAALTLTTTGTSGAATLTGGALNIPNYASGVSASSPNTWSAAQTFNAGDLLDKGEIVFDVKAYGATGNGTTDDTVAIQATVDAAHANGGGIVKFPAGTYKISTNPIKLYSGTTPTIVAYSNITLQGSGSSGVTGTIINQTTTGIDVIKALNDPANGAQSAGIVIQNICVAFSGTATNSGNGIYAAQQATSAPAFIQWTIDNVRANGFGGTGKYGFNFESLIVSTLRDCHAYQCYGGYFFNGSALAHYGSVSTSISLINCYANAPTQYGFRIVNGTYITLQSCACDISTNVTGNAYSIEGCNSVGIYSSGFELDGTHTLANGFYVGADGSSVASLGTTLSGCYGYQSKSSKEIYITGSSKGVIITAYQSNSSVSGSTALTMDTGTAAIELMNNFDAGVATVRTLNATAIDLVLGDSDGYGVVSFPTSLSINGGTALATTSQTGTAGNLVMSVSPTIVTPSFTTSATINAGSIITDTTTGLKIGTATSQKLGFYNATPVIQSVATNDLGVVLSNAGLRAAGTAYPITTSGTITLTGTTNLNNGLIIPLLKKISITTGTNASAGTGTLASGTATISTSVVTASSLIFITDTSGSTGQLSVGTKTAGTSFVVNSSLITDSSTFNWLIIN
jgi:hypothetical protein